MENFKANLLASTKQLGRRIGLLFLVCSSNLFTLEFPPIPAHFFARNCQDVVSFYVVSREPELSWGISEVLN